MRLDWRDWNRVAARVQTLTPDTAAYVVLSEQYDDKAGKRRSQRVGEIDVTPEALQPYLFSSDADEEDDLEELDPEDDDADEEGEEDDDGEDEDEDEEDDRRGLAGIVTGQVSWTRLMAAVLRWIRRTARDNLHGHTTRFRLRAYTSKSEAGPSACFQVVRLEPQIPELPHTPPPLQLPAPTRHDPPELITNPHAYDGERNPFASAAEALAYSSVQHIQFVEYATRNVFATLLEHANQMSRQLAHSKDREETLQGALLNTRIDHVERLEARHHQAQGDAERTALARQALSQLGETTRAVVAAHGLPQELLPVLDSLQRSPELVAQLRDPRVQSLLSDPNAQRTLAALLAQIAQGQGAAAGTAPMMQAPATPPMQASQPMSYYPAQPGQPGPGYVGAGTAFAPPPPPLPPWLQPGAAIPAAPPGAYPGVAWAAPGAPPPASGQYGPGGPAHYAQPPVPLAYAQPPGPSTPGSLPDGNGEPSR